MAPRLVVPFLPPRNPVSDALSRLWLREMVTRVAARVHERSLSRLAGLVAESMRREGR